MNLIELINSVEVEVEACRQHVRASQELRSSPSSSKQIMSAQQGLNRALQRLKVLKALHNPQLPKSDAAA